MQKLCSQNPVLVFFFGFSSESTELPRLDEQRTALLAVFVAPHHVAFLWERESFALKTFIFEQIEIQIWKFVIHCEGAGASPDGGALGALDACLLINGND